MKRTNEIINFLAVCNTVNSIAYYIRKYFSEKDSDTISCMTNSMLLISLVTNH